LATQKAKLGRILAEREKMYRGLLAKGLMDAALVLEKTAELDDIATTFAFFTKHADWIKPEAVRRQQAAVAQRDAAEAEGFADHPAVAAVLATFPGARIASVTPIARPDAYGALSNPDDTHYDTGEAA
jgi:hypothetical protein